MCCCSCLKEKTQTHGQKDVLLLLYEDKNRLELCLPEAKTGYSGWQQGGPPGLHEWEHLAWG